MVAGLPNATGACSRWLVLGGSSSGALPDTRTTGYDWGFGNQGNNTYMQLKLDLSKSNGIYGKSSTVTPLSRKCRFFIKY